RQRSPSSLRSKIQAGSENLSRVSVASSGSSHAGRPVSMRRHYPPARRANGCGRHGAGSPPARISSPGWGAIQHTNRRWRHMGLPACQERILSGIETVLRQGEPHLASRFAIFTRLAGGEELPRTEQLVVEPWPRRWLKGTRLRAVVAIPAALIALTAML